MRFDAAIRLMALSSLAACLVYALGTAPPRIIVPVASIEVDHNDLTSIVEYLRDRWLGDPALWQPPDPPVNTELRFFEVQGQDQSEILQSILAAHLCQTYGCLPDPGNPSGQALALEGEIPGPTEYCIGYQSITFPIRHYILLPHWSPSADGSISKRVVGAWNALLGVIWIHETRHAQIAEADLEELNAEAAALHSCPGSIAFWSNPHLYDKLDADQLAYHAQLRDDCRPDLGCVAEGWMGW